MDWMSITKVVAGLITVLVLVVLIKEFSSAIKDDKEGKPPGKCDLD